MDIARLKKVVGFYARFLVSFSAIGYRARSLGQLAPPQVLISRQISEILALHRAHTGSIWGGIKHPILATLPISTELLQKLKLGDFKD